MQQQGTETISGLGVALPGGGLEERLCATDVFFHAAPVECHFSEVQSGQRFALANGHLVVLDGGLFIGGRAEALLKQFACSEPGVAVAEIGGGAVPVEGFGGIGFAVEAFVVDLGELQTGVAVHAVRRHVVVEFAGGLVVAGLRSGVGAAQVVAGAPQRQRQQRRYCRPTHADSSPHGRE